LWACTLLCYSAKAYVERVIALSVLFAAALTLKKDGVISNYLSGLVG